MAWDGPDIVARFVVGARWEDLPPAVQRMARMAALDTLGATIPGTRTPVSRITAKFAVKTWPGDDATILLHERRASTVGAAFANGYAANGIDIDDCALFTKGHPGAQLFPTALAVAESLGRSGAELLTGLVVGYEVAHRTARIWHATHNVYQACGSWGSVACAAVASHLMRLPVQTVRHALGIADYHAPNLPMMRDIDHPAMVKHGIGWGAMNGILSAQLAAEGFTGIPSVLEMAEHADWVQDIGQNYIMTHGIAWKGYACCAWVHAALKAATDLVREHGIRTADIAHIRVESPWVGVRLGARLPTTTEEAQFNMAWPLAAILVDGEVGPEQILEHRYGDPKIRTLVEKVELVETDELNRLYRLAETGDLSGKYACAVAIRTRDGREFYSGVVEGNINYPQTGWDEARLEAKFRWLVSPMLGDQRTDGLVELMWHLEEVSDVRELTAQLREV